MGIVVENPEEIRYEWIGSLQRSSGVAIIFDGERMNECIEFKVYSARRYSTVQKKLKIRKRKRKQVFTVDLNE